MEPTFVMTPIGIIHSPHRSKESCPVQPGAAAGVQGEVELFPEFAEGLKDVELFTHIHLLYAFDRAGETRLLVQPFLDDAWRGVYATRHPCRPNGIGMSVVALRGRDGRRLLVEGIDVLDGTPLLDIKPYVPLFDTVAAAGSGWLAGKSWRAKPAGRE